jgi:hypothetical protein
MGRQQSRSVIEGELASLAQDGSGDEFIPIHESVSYPGVKWQSYAYRPTGSARAGGPSEHLGCTGRLIQ